MDYVHHVYQSYPFYQDRETKNPARTSCWYVPGRVVRMSSAYLIFVIPFTQTRFSKTKFYTQKTTKDPKKLKMSLKKKVKKYAVFSLNLEKFTPGNKFLHKHRLWCL